MEVTLCKWRVLGLALAVALLGTRTSKEVSKAPGTRTSKEVSKATGAQASREEVCRAPLKGKPKRARSAAMNRRRNRRAGSSSY